MVEYNKLIYESAQITARSSVAQYLVPWQSSTLEVRPGRKNKKLELHYDYDYDVNEGDDTKLLF